MSTNATSEIESIKKARKTYLIVGIILFCGTVATVAVATIPWLDVGEHGFDKWDMLLGLAIASFKASLVAAIFMHLNHERGMVYFMIGLAAIHAIGMFLGTLGHFDDMIYNPYFFHDDERSEPALVE